MDWLRRFPAILAFMGVLAVGLLAPGVSDTFAQRRKSPPPVAKEAPGSRQQDIKREQQPGAKESIEADVSARNIAVTSDFNGTQIVVFGAVDGSQQPSAESGYYDVIIVVEGVPSRMVVRRKGNVAGLWLNTASVIFDNVPSYYAVASNRPIDEIAPPVTARPWACVSRLSSLQRTPPCARTVRAAGSTWIPFIGERSIITPPSATARPATLWPPPRTEISSPLERAMPIAAATSAAPWQRAISAGRRSIIPLWTRLASS